jgi:hypothetical protein
MASGYIYVLVNSSMPGLVKVGKTTRDPALRVAELSGVTGVATPFILAFEQFFLDCDSAEEFIHATLERQGLRQTNNREFFRAQPNDVIRVILQTPGIAEKACNDPNQEDEANEDLLSKDDPLPDFQLEGWQPPKPWDEMLEQADGHHYGYGEYIQDDVEALKLYKDAARLGSLIAYERIGEIYDDGGEGVKQDLDKALQYWKEGARRGNYYCYAMMSSLFFRNGQTENFYKAFKQFLNQRRISPIQEVETFSTKHCFSISDYLRFCLINSIEFRFVEDLKPFGDELKQCIGSWISQRQQENVPGNDRVIELNEAILKWIEKNLYDQKIEPKVQQLIVDHAPRNAKRPSAFSKWFGRS